MLSGVFGTGPLPFLKEMAKFAERRQEVLAGNIANIDTPGYRMHDLPVADFQKALQRGIALQRQSKPTSGSSSQSLGMGQSLGGILPGLAGAATSNALPLRPEGFAAAPPTLAELFPRSMFEAKEVEQQPNLTYQDGNNRSVEMQFLQMTKNLTTQQFALQLLTQQYSQLQLALEGESRG